MHLNRQSVPDLSIVSLLGRSAVNRMQSETIFTKHNEEGDHYEF